MRNTHGRTWNMARKLTKKKMRNSHGRTWNMSRKTLENVKNEKGPQ